MASFARSSLRQGKVLKTRDLKLKDVAAPLDRFDICNVRRASDSLYLGQSKKNGTDRGSESLHPPSAMTQ